MQAKVEALGTPRGTTVRTALVYEGRLSPRVKADGYFGFLIPAERLFDVLSAGGCPALHYLSVAVTGLDRFARGAGRLCPTAKRRTRAHRPVPLRPLRSDRWRPHPSRALAWHGGC